jgi:hypothetical protein
MPFEKGNSGNPAGRPQGTRNKTTEELRNTIQAFIENNIESMQANFDQLEPKEKLMFIEKMLGYSIPKLQSLKIDELPNKETTSIITLTDEQFKQAMNELIPIL